MLTEVRADLANVLAWAAGAVEADPDKLFTDIRAQTRKIVGATAAIVDGNEVLPSDDVALLRATVDALKSFAVYISRRYTWDYLLGAFEVAIDNLDDLTENHEIARAIGPVYTDVAERLGRVSP